MTPSRFCLHAFALTTLACGGNTSASASDEPADGGGFADGGRVPVSTDGGVPVGQDAGADAPSPEGGTITNPAVRSSAIDDATTVMDGNWIVVNGADRKVFGATLYGQPSVGLFGNLGEYLNANIKTMTWTTSIPVGRRLVGPGVAMASATSFVLAAPLTGGGTWTKAQTVTTGMAQRVRVRGRAVSGYSVQGPYIVAVDSPRIGNEANVCPSGTTLNLISYCVDPGTAAFTIPTLGGAAATITSTAGQATIDDVRPASNGGVIVVGRLDGAGTYNFSGAAAATQVTGPAFFFARYDGTALTYLTALAVDGVLPSASSPPELSDEPGFGITIAAASTVKYLVTAPFTGTMHVPGNPDLLAPKDSYATALLQFDPTTGTVTSAWAFGKGPLSMGKPSHAVADLAPAPGGVFFADTVWDSIDFGGGHVAKAVHGGDVVVTRLTDAGDAIEVNVYGGAGDDEPLGINSNLVYGRSSGSLDFGNGPLVPSAGKSQIWFATFN